MLAYTHFLKLSGVCIRKPFYIDLTVWLDPTDFSLITIEDNAVLARGVQVLVHDYSPRQGLLATGHNLRNDCRIDRPVYIGENVFIGINSILKPGTHLEAHCLVASGSVVSGHFTQYSLIAGNPATKVGDVRDWIEKKKVNDPSILSSIKEKVHFDEV